MKRFTDCDKWRKEWWQNLSPSGKLLWYYITENCNVAGVWEVNFRLAEFQINAKINKEEIQRQFQKQIIVLAGGTKWFIRNFVKFQYGKDIDNLNENVGVDRAIKRIVEKELAGVDLNNPAQGLLLEIMPDGQKKRRKKLTGDVVAMAKEITELNNEMFITTWQDWIVYRRELGKKITPSTARRQLKKLASWGIDNAVKSIQRSIEKGWTGLFEIKDVCGRKKLSDLLDKGVDDEI